MSMQLDPRLESDSTFVIDLKLCQVRLSHNAAFAWILLIPKRDAIVEIIDLTPSDQYLLIEEVSLASHVMKSLFQPTKLNVASLGNVVPQLHIHVVARSEDDPAWPQPIWNSRVSTSYNFSVKALRIKLLKNTFLNFISNPSTEG